MFFYVPVAWIAESEEYSALQGSLSCQATISLLPGEKVPTKWADEGEPVA